MPGFSTGPGASLRSFAMRCGRRSRKRVDGRDRPLAATICGIAGSRSATCGGVPWARIRRDRRAARPDRDGEYRHACDDWRDCACAFRRNVYGQAVVVDSTALGLFEGNAVFGLGARPLNRARNQPLGRPPPTLSRRRGVLHRRRPSGTLRVRLATRVESGFGWDGSLAASLTVKERGKR